jgi:hypothetical protein
MVNGFFLAAPGFILFEIWQLVMSERYVGIKQIARGANPREMGPGEVVACFWSSGLFLYGVWMVGLLAFTEGRVFALCLLGTTAVGYAIRRNCGIKFILVVLTIEGAVRVGFLAFFSSLVLSHL